MWRKFHSLPCRSVAPNSCMGGCRDISWIATKTKLSARKVQIKKDVNYESINMLKIRKYLEQNFKPTNGGRQSSACLLRTENPPWVLVSEAVSVLQNEWTVHLWGSGSGGSGLVTSLCWSKRNNKSRQAYNRRRRNKIPCIRSNYILIVNADTWVKNCKKLLSPGLYCKKKDGRAYI